MILVVLLGPPGAGKGTQAALLAERRGWEHVSTGDLFREHLRNGTSLGDAARGYMSRGELVPDEIVIGMVRERLTGGGEGFVLDGFPRTSAQAEALDDIAGDDARRLVAVALEVPEAELMRRLTGRRVCRDADHVYHLVYRPPRQPGVCDIDGSPLVQREDDTEATVARRLEVYGQETAPVLAYYEASSRLRPVDGEGDRAVVTGRLLDALPELVDTTAGAGAGRSIR